MEPESALRSAARATTVVGKILDSLSKKRGVNSKYSCVDHAIGPDFLGARRSCSAAKLSGLAVSTLAETHLLPGGAVGCRQHALLAKEVQQFALTAFGITAAVHLAVLILRDLIQSKNRWANLGKAMGGVVLAALIVIGGLAVSAVLGGEFAWNVIWSARAFVLSEDDFGINFKTLTKVLLILGVFAVFLISIRKDLKALLQKKHVVFTGLTRFSGFTGCMNNE